MTIPRATCPECRATLSAKTGFRVGQVLTCPKCDTYFEVTAAKPVAAKPPDDPDDRRPPKNRAPQVIDDDENVPVKRKKPAPADAGEEDGRPRKKSRRPDDDEVDDRSKKKKKKSAGSDYRTSPVRFIVLGILLVVLIVLGAFLYLKWKSEQNNTRRPAHTDRMA